MDPKARMSVLKQNQGMYDAYTVLDTVIMGNMRLYECGKEKDAIYEKADFTDEDSASQPPSSANSSSSSEARMPSSSVKSAFS